jgi:superfamily II DNA or RNA helicase
VCPFQYFGVHDGSDLSSLKWARGGYDVADLEKVYTGNDARVRMVLQQVVDKHREWRQVRALGFYVSVAHAEYMARRFTEAGLPSIAVSADTPNEDRATALTQLRAGQVRALFAVDLFNEGVDLPEVDTIMFLRPTESALVFLQQLGRGLRRHERQGLRDGAGLHRAGPPEVPVRPALPRDHRRHAWRGGKAGRAWLSVPPGRLLDAARSRRH